jgi:hypothetical protein
MSMQVSEQGQQKGEASPFLAELLRLEEQAKHGGLGLWSKVCLALPLFQKLCNKGATFAALNEHKMFVP